MWTRGAQLHSLSVVVTFYPPHPPQPGGELDFIISFEIAVSQSDYLHSLLHRSHNHRHNLRRTKQC